MTGCRPECWGMCCDVGKSLGAEAGYNAQWDPRGSSMHSTWRMAGDAGSVTPWLGGVRWTPS